MEDRIIQYIDDELNSSEKIKFENELKTNDTLKKEYEAYLQVINGVKASERRQLKNIISDISDNSFQNKTTNNKTIQMETRNKSFIMVAASLLVLAAAGYFMFNNSNTNEFDMDNYLATNYNSEYDGTVNHLSALAKSNIVTRNGNPDEDTITVMHQGQRIKMLDFEKIEKQRKANLIAGINSYKKSNWLESVQLLNSYVTSYTEQGDDRNMALFYLAKAKLNNGNNANALTTFSEFLASNCKDEKMIQTAQWDRAICYMKIDESKVKELLATIAENNGHMYQNDASSLMRYYE